MNEINIQHIASIPGVTLTPLKDEISKETKETTLFKVTLDSSNYEFQPKQINYKLMQKDLSFKERYQLGKLSGSSTVAAFFKALTTYKKSQEDVAKYYIEQIKHYPISKLFSNELKEYEKNISREDLEANIETAFFDQPSGGSAMSKTAFESLVKKAKTDLSNIQFNSAHKTATIIEENFFQFIGSIPIRKNPYTYFKVSGILDDVKNTINNRLINLQDEPIFKHAHEIQDQFLNILGFEKIERD